MGLELTNRAVPPLDEEGAAAQLTHRPGVVAAAVYENGVRLRDIRIEDAGKWRSRPGAVIWIGLHEPDVDLLHQLQREFDLHDLAIEDAGKAHQRPKLEIYGDSIFVVARTAHMVGDEIAFLAREVRQALHDAVMIREHQAVLRDEGAGAAALEPRRRALDR